MYEIHSTEALIIRVVASGESDHYVSFYTKEHGRLNAFVTSSRKNESKHRYHLVLGNIVMLSYVQGRQELRVTGLDTLLSVLNPNHSITDRQLLGRFLFLFEKLVGGSEEDEELFTMLYSFLSFFSNEWLSDEYKEFVVELEMILTLRLLAHLGYLDSNAFTLATLDGPEVFSIENLTRIKNNHVAAAATLNKVLSELQF